MVVGEGGPGFNADRLVAVDRAARVAGPVADEVRVRDDGRRARAGVLVGDRPPTACGLVGLEAPQAQVQGRPVHQVDGAPVAREGMVLLEDGAEEERLGAGRAEAVGRNADGRRPHRRCCVGRCSHRRSGALCSRRPQPAHLRRSRGCPRSESSTRRIRCRPRCFRPRLLDRSRTRCPGRRPWWRGCGPPAPRPVPWR